MPVLSSISLVCLVVLKRYSCGDKNLYICKLNVSAKTVDQIDERVIWQQGNPSEFYLHLITFTLVANNTLHP